MEPSASPRSEPSSTPSADPSISPSGAPSLASSASPSGALAVLLQVVDPLVNLHVVPQVLLMSCPLVLQAPSSSVLLRLLIQVVPHLLLKALCCPSISPSAEASVKPSASSRSFAGL